MSRKSVANFLEIEFENSQIENMNDLRFLKDTSEII